MTSGEFSILKSKVLAELDQHLDPRLTYHCRQHTEDVLQHTERIAIAENIIQPRMLLLMKTAALFHDTGFVDIYVGHEERSCEIMIKELKGFDFDDSEITLMTGMIMATKVPQSPKALHEMVLCDADLDYLGRDDFPVINKRLKNELLAFGFIKDLNEWNELQVNFLSKHRYFTNSSVELREPVKRSHLSSLRQSFETAKPKPD
jgi:predicted metal-dependent HD superfamily phosphohydrolase